MPASRKALLIVYHSMTGGARQMAEAAAAGGLEEDINVWIKPAEDAGAADLLAADGFIFATPENLASMSGKLKDFFDRTYYAALDQLNGRPYLQLICAGSDGRNAAQQIARIATGWRLKSVAEPYIVCTRASAPEDILRPKILAPSELEACHDLGRMIAGGLALGIF